MYPVPRAGNMQLAATTSKRIARKRKWGEEGKCVASD